MKTSAQKAGKKKTKSSTATFHQCLAKIYGQPLIFPINAKNPDAEDHKVAEELTKAILRVASSLEPRKTPISWFEFEKHIHMLGKKLLRWKECLEFEPFPVCNAAYVACLHRRFQTGHCQGKILVNCAYCLPLYYLAE